MKLLMIMSMSEATNCILNMLREESFITRCDQREPDPKEIEADIDSINSAYSHIVVKSCSRNGQGAKCLKFLLDNFHGKLIETNCCQYKVLPDCLPFETPKILSHLRYLEYKEERGVE